jgi:hypothetical protein
VGGGQSATWSARRGRCCPALGARVWRESNQGFGPVSTAVGRYGRVASGPNTHLAALLKWAGLGKLFLTNSMLFNCSHPSQLVKYENVTSIVPTFAR